MTDQEFLEYRDGRYSEMLRYYDKQAVRNRLCHFACSVYVLAVSVAISPISILLKESSQVVVAVLSPTVALVAAIGGLYHFHQNWLRYRATWDALKHEINWRNARIGPYETTPDRNRMFVTQVESLISREGAEWVRTHAPKPHGETGSVATPH